VGQYDNSAGVPVPLAERRSGTSWSIQNAPSPTGSVGGDLLGLSCHSTSACTAVGNYKKRSRVNLTLAESWNGTSWAIRSTPNPTGATGSTMGAVSCHSTGNCSAVGGYDNSSNVELTLAESWNGTSWGIETTPNPTGAAISYLDAVSCPTASSCVAVGNSGKSAPTLKTLSEHK
jgi:hypothetical protein